MTLHTSYIVLMSPGFALVVGVATLAGRPWLNSPRDLRGPNDSEEP